MKNKNLLFAIFIAIASIFSLSSFNTYATEDYTVTFKDFDDSILKTENVSSGGSATAPETNPTREGYNFRCWDTDFSNVTQNLTVTALYSYIVTLNDITFSDSTGSIIRYHNLEEKNIEIPESFNIDGNDINVTTVADTAFYRRYLTSVVLPNTLTEIKKMGFYNNNIDSIYIPPSVKTIGEKAFAYCKLKKLRLSEGLTQMDFRAFGDNSDLKEVTIPGSLKTIARSGFSTCGLETVIINEGVETIKEYAFCINKIKSIVIPSSVKTIKYAAFSNNQITEVNGNPHNGIFYSLNNSITDSTYLSSYGGPKRIINFIPPQVKIIGSYCFGNMGIDSLIIPDHIEKIGGEAFSGNNLKHVNIPNSVVLIGYAAFYYNNSLSSFTLPTHPDFGDFGWVNSKNDSLSSGDIVTDYATTYRIPDVYSVNYSLNEGTNSENNPTLYHSKLGITTLEVPTREGYNFSGWYLNSYFRDTVTTPVIEIGATKDKLFFAKWDKISANNTINAGQIAVYPNPTNGLLTVRLNDKTIQSITINDITGKQVLQQFPEESNTTIDLTQMKKGIYLLSIKSDNRIVTKRIVKE